MTAPVRCVGAAKTHLEVCQHEFECLGPLAVLVQHGQLDGVIANLQGSDNKRVNKGEDGKSAE